MNDAAAVSRRTRPAKEPLSRAGIVAAAAGILASEGLGKVTLRSVAKVLDTGHASLYVYIRNTADLHAQLLDGQLAKIVFPDSADWRSALKLTLYRYLEVLNEYPEISKMALVTRPSGPNYLALVDGLVGLLLAGGASRKAAAWGVDLLLLYPTAIAVEHAPGTDSQGPAAQAARIEMADPEDYPNISALAGELFTGTGTGRFDWALDVLIEGIISAHSGGK